MASGGSPSLISLYSSSAKDLQGLEGIGPKRAERIVALRNRGAFTMAELVIASGKSCAEWRELFSVGRVEPLEEEGSMLSAPPRTPSPRSTPQPPTTVPSPDAGVERTGTSATIGHFEASFRDYLAGFSEKVLGELSHVRRSVEDLDSRVVQVSRSVEDLDNRMKCQEEEAFRRSVSSGSPGGARGGRIVAAPPSPKPDPDQASRRIRTIPLAPHVADPCLKSIVEAIPPSRV